jgi:cytochrome c-type biogenesis protein CcmE
MEEEKEERKISEKQIKIVILIVLIIVVIGILFWGMVPEKIYEVSQILEDPTEYDGMNVNIKGDVTGWDLSNNFTLAYSDNYNVTINASNNRTFPEGFANNETVVVTGTFTYTNGTAHIASRSIQIGCPSKY